jgi:hypothetical protein
VIQCLCLGYLRLHACKVIDNNEPKIRYESITQKTNIQVAHVRSEACRICGPTGEVGERWRRHGDHLRLVRQRDILVHKVLEVLVVILAGVVPAWKQARSICLLTQSADQVCRNDATITRRWAGTVRDLAQSTERMLAKLTFRFCHFHPPPRARCRRRPAGSCAHQQPW